MPGPAAVVVMHSSKAAPAVSVSGPCPPSVLGCLVRVGVVWPGCGVFAPACPHAPVEARDGGALKYNHINEDTLERELANDRLRDSVRFKSGELRVRPSRQPQAALGVPPPIATARKHFGRTRLRDAVPEGHAVSYVHVRRCGRQS